MNKKILIIYSYMKSFKRKSSRIHLDCFSKYSSDQIFYHNIERYRIPKYLLSIEFDLIIFHTSFLVSRWNEKRFDNNVRKCEPLKKTSTIKIILPQDEHFKINKVLTFINDFKIDKIYTVSPISEWNRLYGNLSTNIEILPILTGYIDTESSRNYKYNDSDRVIDIGYRVKKNSYSLGKHGHLKFEIANIFEKINESYNTNFKLDISTDMDKTFFDDEWLDFLASCRFTIGVEGGASILDTTGEKFLEIEDYLKEKQNIDFYEVQKKFLKDDEDFKYYALSPRHLEACITRTCQILIEGEYSGVLKKDYHYISLNRDFSNLEEVINKMKDEDLRLRIINNAYEDIVKSGQYSYKIFVDLILNNSTKRENSKNHYFEYLLTKFKDWYYWKENTFLNCIGYYK